MTIRDGILDGIGRLPARIAPLVALLLLAIVISACGAAGEGQEQAESGGSATPDLVDQDLSVVRFFDFLPKPGQPMGGMSGVAQMGFVVIDANGTIRIQRVDVNFGDHAGQIHDILDAVSEPQAVIPPAPTAGSLDTPHQWYPYIG